MSKIENMEYVSRNCGAIAKQRGFDPAVYKYLPNLVANQKPSLGTHHCEMAVQYWIYNFLKIVYVLFALFFQHRTHNQRLHYDGGPGMFSAKLVHPFEEFQLKPIQNS